MLDGCLVYFFQRRMVFVTSHGCSTSCHRSLRRDLAQAFLGVPVYLDGANGRMLNSVTHLFRTWTQSSGSSRMLPMSMQVALPGEQQARMRHQGDPLAAKLCTCHFETTTAAEWVSTTLTHVAMIAGLQNLPC
jgi:hypothetical protein